MTELECPGLPASWLNAWLAAIGATVLVPEMCLSWTDDAVPIAVLQIKGDGNPVGMLAESWPDDTRIENLPIATSHDYLAKLPRKVSVGAFGERVAKYRGHPDAWTLSSTMTDLYVNKEGMVEHSRLDPPVPGGLTLHDRLCEIRKQLNDPSELENQVSDSLAGCSSRVAINGLGFDITRLGSLADDTNRLVDPVIELLAFFGLALFPVRSDGFDYHDTRVGRATKDATAPRTRCWNEAPGSKVRRMSWPAWSSPLGRFAIDALLDCWNPSKRRLWATLGVQAGWTSVEYRKRKDSDVTKGIGSIAL